MWDGGFYFQNHLQGLNQRNNREDNKGDRMRYKNKKTGAVVEVRSELSGGDWEKIAPKTIKKTTSKTAERKSAVKKDE
ncbi:Uncharacterised protein [uncultured Clostridium sp.]|jgi:hypothetical protein|nr:Uncharacterised protein [uncultured Clostridium sp.]